MDNVYGTEFLKYVKNYTPLESIIGLLIIVAYADEKLDEFEKSSINYTINEFKKAGAEENDFYKLWKDLDEIFKREIYDCALNNYEIEKLIKKFCETINYLDKEVKIVFMKQVITMITLNNVYNECQYKLVKKIAKCLNFSNDYVDNILNQLGFYNKWFNSDKTNSEKEQSNTYKNPYEILSVSEFDDIETIKKKYKELVKKFHPDFISGKGLDEEFIKFANEKLKEINWAYEEIMKKYTK